MLKVKLITPESSILDQSGISFVTIHTDTGIISVYPDHMDLFSKLSQGSVIVKFSDSAEESEYFVDSGIIRVTGGDSVLILTDYAQNVAEIDIKEAEEARLKAEQVVLEHSESINSEDFVRAQATLIRELGRIRAAKNRLRKG